MCQCHSVKSFKRSECGFRRRNGLWIFLFIALASINILGGRRESHKIDIDTCSLVEEIIWCIVEVRYCSLCIFLSYFSCCFFFFFYILLYSYDLLHALPLFLLHLPIIHVHLFLLPFLFSNLSSLLHFYSRFTIYFFLIFLTI